MFGRYRGEPSVHTSVEFLTPSRLLSNRYFGSRSHMCGFARVLAICTATFIDLVAFGRPGRIRRVCFRVPLCCAYLFPSPHADVRRGSIAGRRSPPLLCCAGCSLYSTSQMASRCFPPGLKFTFSSSDGGALHELSRVSYLVSNQLVNSMNVGSMEHLGGEEPIDMHRNGRTYFA